jgi:LPS sulfotransferase NodH
MCQSEVFNSDSKSLPYPLSTPTREVLEKWVFRNLPDEICCAGFVLQAYHPFGLEAFPGIRENPRWGDVWPILQAMPNLHVIHLQRQNLLRRHLSHVLARETGKWHDWDAAQLARLTHLGEPFTPKIGRTTRPKVRLDPDRLNVDFREVEQLNRRVTERFGHLRYHHMSYEKLCARTDVELLNTLQFLGLDAAQNSPPVALQSAVSKLENRSLNRSIENYEELKMNFAATRWAHFFDDV